MRPTPPRTPARHAKERTPPPPEELLSQLLEQLRGDAGRGRIRCPRCGWRPRPSDVWSCRCGCVWNTFDTRGVCPDCHYRWRLTQCLSCQEFSPHEDWYPREPREG